MKKEITAAELRNRLTYDSATGLFRWKKHPYKNRVGQIATTTKQKCGRCVISINGKQHLVHRLVWLYIFGYLPRGIDHKNGNPADNRLSNLREANQSQNIANAPPRKDSKLGIRGVSVRRGKYRVAFHKNGKQVHVGDFATLDEATAAAKKASIEIHGEFSFYARRPIVDPSSRTAEAQP